MCVKEEAVLLGLSDAFTLLLPENRLKMFVEIKLMLQSHYYFLCIVVGDQYRIPKNQTEQHCWDNYPVTKIMLLSSGANRSNHNLVMS